MTTAAARVPRNAIVRSEVSKLLGVRAYPVLAVTAVVAAGLLALLLCVSLPLTRGATVAELPAADVLGAALLGVDLAAIVLVVLAATAAGSEYATGLTQPTYLLTPRRGRVLQAKALVTAALAALVGVVAVVACVAVAQGVLVAAGVPVADLGAPGQRRLVAGSALTPVFYAIVALAAAVATRSTGGGIATALGLFVLPTAVGWVPGPPADAVVVLPAAALHGISGAASPGSAEFLPAGGAVALLAAWILAVLAVAAARLRSRDV